MTLKCTLQAERRVRTPRLIISRYQEISVSNERGHISLEFVVTSSCPLIKSLKMLNHTMRSLSLVPKVELWRWYWRSTINLSSFSKHGNYKRWYNNLLETPLYCSCHNILMNLCKYAISIFNLAHSFEVLL